MREKRECPSNVISQREGLETMRQYEALGETWKTSREQLTQRSEEKMSINKMIER